MKTLTADQLSAFFQEARDSGVYELYYLDLATGLRRGELLGLKWTDIDLDRGVLKIQRAISRQNGKVVEAPLKTKNAYAAVLAQAKQKQDEQARQDSRKEASKAIFDADTLTTELAELLIDRVLVYPDKRIEIAYKIQDIFD